MRSPAEPTEAQFQAQVIELARRFWPKVTIQLGGCWLWRAARTGNGYGALKVDGKMLGAHVVAWALANGRWPEPGEVIRHSCDVTLCVNPSHLAPGSQSDNARDSVARGRNAQTRKSACPRGHAYDYTDPRGARQCKTCRRDSLRRLRARRAA